MDTRFTGGLSDNARKSVNEILNARLVDVIDLTLAVKQAHWTLKGAGFIGVHELLDDVADRLRESSDLMAERAVTIGGHADGTSQAVSKSSNMEAYPADITDIEAHINALLERFNVIGSNVRQSIEEVGEAGDEGSADVLTEVVRQIDKDAWFIGANIKK